MQIPHLTLYFDIMAKKNITKKSRTFEKKLPLKKKTAQIFMDIRLTPLK